MNLLIELTLGIWQLYAVQRLRVRVIITGSRGEAGSVVKGVRADISFEGFGIV